MSSPQMTTMLGFFLSAACAATALNAVSNVTAHLMSLLGLCFMVLCFNGVQFMFSKRIVVYFISWQSITRRARFHAAKSDMIAARAGFSLAACADHVTRAILVSAKERAAAV